MGVPTTDFLKDIYQLACQTSEMPYNLHDEGFILWNVIMLELEEVPGKDDWIHFIGIESIAPGQGKANLVMQNLVRLLDQHGIVLAGKPKAYGKRTISTQALRGWYRKFGCSPVDPQDEDGVWIRPPAGRTTPIDVNLEGATLGMIQQGMGNYEYSRRNNWLYLLGTVGVLAALSRL